MTGDFLSYQKSAAKSLESFRFNLAQIRFEYGDKLQTLLKYGFECGINCFISFFLCF